MEQLWLVRAGVLPGREWKREAEVEREEGLGSVYSPHRQGGFAPVSFVNGKFNLSEDLDRHLIFRVLAHLLMGRYWR